MIETMGDHYTVTELCDAFEVSRSGYYKGIRTGQGERKKENQQLIEAMRQIHQEPFKNAYGSPRMTVELRRRGVHLLGESSRATHGRSRSHGPS